MLMNRRTFFKRCLWSTTAGAVVGCGYHSTLVEPRRVGINHVRVPVRGLPRAFDGLTIAQLSDLHRSRVISVEYLNHCVDLANALRPDLITFTGDYIMHTKRLAALDAALIGDRELAPRFVREVAGVIGRAHARLGVFTVLGNHDHWYDGEPITAAIRDAGATVLRNANTTVHVNGEALPIVGLGDLWTEGLDFTTAFAGVDAPFTLVLMHNPDAFARWRRPGAQLILASHTHGGQVKLPLIGAPMVPSRYGQRYAHGLYPHADAWMYVNRGVGMIYPPVRLNCPPEIALLRLESA